MTQDSSRIVDWLRQVMTIKAWSGTTWANLAGVSPSTVSRALRPDSKFIPSTKTLQKLAAVAPVPAPDTLTATTTVAPIRALQVRGVVMAGYFQEAHDFGFEADDDSLATIPIAITGYEHADLYALRIEGTSMNLVYPEPNTHVIVCPIGQTSIHDGDLVIATRTVSDLVETTCKQLQLSANGKWLLVPRSNDPAHQKPVEMNGDGISIIGAVVGAWIPRSRSGTAWFPSEILLK